MLTHFAESGHVIVHSVLQKSYLLTLNILFILLLLGVPGRHFILTKMFLKLCFGHNSDTHIKVCFFFLSYLFFLSILEIVVEEISSKDVCPHYFLTLTRYFDRSYFPSV